MHLRRTLGLDIPCQDASQQSLTPFLQALGSLPFQHLGGQILSDTRAMPQKIPRRSRASRSVAVLSMRTLEPDEPDLIGRPIRSSLGGTTLGTTHGGFTATGQRMENRPTVR